MSKQNRTEIINKEVLAHQAGDTEAVNRLYPYIDNMAWKVAHKYAKGNKGILEDYHQLAWCGAMKAVNRFDKDNEKGSTFGTFCYICMSQTIVQHWRKNKKHDNEFDEDGEPVRLMQSLDAQLTDDGFTLGEVLPGEYECLEDLACEEWEKEFLVQELKKCSAVDREIVVCMMNGIPQDIIGTRVGLAQSHVSRHYQSFIKKCKSRLEFEEARTRMECGSNAEAN